LFKINKKIMIEICNCLQASIIVIWPMII
jgi:hypothetical protein